MKRFLIVDICLAAFIALVVVADAKRSRAADDVRAEKSAFRPIAEAGLADDQTIARLIVTVPPSWKVQGFEKTLKWTYVKNGERWELPEFHDADAATEDIENLRKLVGGAYGTTIGRFPEDAERFGLDAEKRIDLEWADASGQVRTHATFGANAPGERADECYAVDMSRTRILRIDANPWAICSATRPARIPPFVDLSIIPRSLHRGMPSKISFTGQPAGDLKELIRREIPKPETPNPMEREDRGPRYEWFAKTDRGEQKISATGSFEYAGAIANATLDGYVPNRGQIRDPLLVIALEFPDGKTDRLELGRAAEKGFHPIAYSGTGKVFWLSPEKARRFLPDVARLFDLSLDQRPPERPTTPDGMSIPTSAPSHR